MATASSDPTPHLVSETAVILIAFDVECTGSDFLKHAMVELGAVAYAYDHEPPVDGAKRPRTERQSLHVFLGTMGVPEGRGWEDQCVREFWDNPERSDYELLKTRYELFKKCAITPETVMKSFVRWVDDVVTIWAGGDSSRIRFVSDNAAYDAAWVGLYLCQYADHLPLTVFFDNKFQAIIDTSSYHQGLSRIDHIAEREIKEKRGHYSEDRVCRAIIEVPKDVVPTVKHNHCAAQDAGEIVQQHLIILDQMRKLVAIPLHSAEMKKLLYPSE